MIINTTHGDIHDYEMTLNTEKVDNDDELMNAVEYWLVSDEKCLDPSHDVSVEQPDGRWAERVHRSAQVIKKRGIIAYAAVGSMN